MINGVQYSRNTDVSQRLVIYILKMTNDRKISNNISS